MSLYSIHRHMILYNVLEMVVANDHFTPIAQDPFSVLPNGLSFRDVVTLGSVSCELRMRILARARNYNIRMPSQSRNWSWKNCLHEIYLREDRVGEEFSSHVFDISTVMSCAHVILHNLNVVHLTSIAANWLFVRCREMRELNNCSMMSNLTTLTLEINSAFEQTLPTLDTNQLPVKLQKLFLANVVPQGNWQNLTSIHVVFECIFNQPAIDLTTLPDTLTYLWLHMCQVKWGNNLPRSLCELTLRNCQATADSEAVPRLSEITQLSICTFTLMQPHVWTLNQGNCARFTSLRLFRSLFDSDFRDEVMCDCEKCDDVQTIPLTDTNMCWSIETLLLIGTSVSAYAPQLRQIQYKNIGADNVLMLEATYPNADIEDIATDDEFD